MTVAAIYARRSTDQQEASLDRQVAECERYIEAARWELGEVYSDSTSAWKENTPRPAFDRMMRDAQAGAFAVLVVWEVSRLSRQEGDDSALAVIWRLRKAGVEVHSVSERSTGNTLADDLSLLVKSHAAKEESDAKSKRVISGKRKGLLEGIYQGASACYGFRRAGKVERGHRNANLYEIDPEQASILHEILSAYVGEGATPQAIAERLNERGVKPPGGRGTHRYERRGAAVWHQSTVRHLIGSPLIAGFATYRGERVKACACASIEALAAAKGAKAKAEAVRGWRDCPHEWVRTTNVPAIIDPAVWERARALLIERGGRRGNHTGRGNRPEASARFLMAGLVWCEECGERLGIRSKDDVYRCRGRRMNTCTMPPIARAKLDEAVRESFVEQFVDQVDLQATLERERDRLLALRDERSVLLRDEIAEVEREQSAAEDFRTRLDDDYAVGDLSGPSYERLYKGVRARLERARAARERLTAKLAEVEGSLSTAEIDTLLDRLNSMRRIIQGHLQAEDVQLLNVKLREVFHEFRLSREGNRLIVEPRLRREWMPEGDWHTLDFGEQSDELTVEVVDYVEPVMRRVDLTSGLNSYSW